jgi:hypothetical protein
MPAAHDLPSLQRRRLQEIGGWTTFSFDKARKALVQTHGKVRETPVLTLRMREVEVSTCDHLPTRRQLVVVH